ncbi:MAG: inositol-3-phosphate synthase [Planctomycetes bacterium]|nr:inositol-3-phosphate synthase [Planctomycetota bacterium]MCA8947084.1 inositol-3-phosphate synthase [Planctomycetota bacterium]
MARTGVYFIGARGNVATTAMVGAIAISQGRSPATGMVTDGPEFKGLPLIGVQDLLFGGADVSIKPLPAKAVELANARILPTELAVELKDELETLDKQLHTVKGFAFGSVPDGGYLAELTRIEERLARFRSDNNLDRVVVVNVSSTEPHFAETPDYDTPEQLMKALTTAGGGFTSATLLNALAALRQGCAYVNFTPSQASELPALRKIARDSRLPHAGKDGKTGETLLKTVLGPMFLARNLKVMSWVGNNFLGNNDGAVLDAPASKDSKLRQKDAALREMLGGAFVKTDIQYVPSLGDWKTAWDLIHFQGFLGTPMTMTFTWQGCDSALAAPLVLDLVRLTDLAWQREESGLLAQLAPFFKNPLDGHTHDFHQQMAGLYAWLDVVRAGQTFERK